jgi:hypothetical protein
MRPMSSTRQTQIRSALLTEGDRKIIHLSTRAGAPRPSVTPVRWNPMSDPPVAGLERYECRSQTDDDYRHQMLVNLLATIVVIVLIATGDWIVQTMAQTNPESRNVARPMQAPSALGFEPLTPSKL